MDLSDLRPPPGATRRARRVGRGIGSGSGKTAGRGHKGRGSRSGGNTPPSYEGGQMPLQRRVPKRGFRRLLRNAALRDAFAAVNLGRLKDFAAGDRIDPVVLAERGIIRGGRKLKILGDGELAVKLTIHAHAFSAGAREKITRAGGVAQIIGEETQD
ncbi:MAG TPA: 50S ribosomal protein L15 [Candidatus Binataceae bacterium]|nr:50S ribosomal protein L15 [Candidatus Binataceae bacterium]HVB80067.1 50S ribosomal protein L15 [Candidatus Binataceae bacterium]